MSTSYHYNNGENVELLPLSQLWPLPEQWLATMKPNPNIVEAFVAGMRRGDLFPPIFVRFGRRYDCRFAVINSVHRTAASLLLGYSMIPARQ
jgi:hypothetical protein